MSRKRKAPKKIPIVDPKYKSVIINEELDGLEVTTPEKQT